MPLASESQYTDDVPDINVVHPQSRQDELQHISVLANGHESSTWAVQPLLETAPSNGKLL